MAEFVSLVLLILSELWQAVFGSFLFWVVLVFVAIQYRRIAKTRENLFGIRGSSVLKDTAIATMYGIIGGILTSLLLVFTGINLSGVGIGYIWPLALILMLLNPRFLCFAYAGGVVALSKLIFGAPQVDIPQLMGLVAILHLVESLLISVTGHVGTTPIYTKNASGQLVGGFILQKFWPLPVVAVAFLTNSSGYTVLPSMPSWWPLIKFDHGFSFYAIGLLVPFVAGLGYSDLALANTPVEKSKMSARNLSVFSLILLLLALLASRFHLFAYLAAIFAPLGHEAVIYFGKNTELKGKPIFVPPLRGVRILEAVPHTPGGRAGLKSGDVIYTVNGQAVSSKRDIETLTWTRPSMVEIEYITHARRKWQRAIIKLKPHQSLGIITVPEGDELMYTDFTSQSLISHLFGKLVSKK